MAGDAFEETLAGFRRWAGTTERKLSGDPEENAAELYTAPEANPLALHAIAAKLRSCDVHVPDLPPPGEMTADDVMLLSMFGTEEDFAAGEDAAIRVAAVQVASRLGDAAEPALREALDRRELRCYAKMTLIARPCSPARSGGTGPHPEVAVLKTATARTTVKRHGGSA